jgi:hypothetical protein
VEELSRSRILYVFKGDKLAKAELVWVSFMEPVSEWEESLEVPENSNLGCYFKRTRRHIQEAG